MSNNSITLNQIIHGDCMEWLPRIPDASVDMILCDLPYGSTKCAWDTPLPLEELWKQYRRVVKPRGAIVLFGSQPFSSRLVSSNYAMFRHSWIWNKVSGGNFINAKHQPIKVHEEVLVFSTESAIYHPQMMQATRPRSVSRPTIQRTSFISKTQSGTFKASSTYDGRKLYPKSIVTFSAQAKECNNSYRYHSTQKPVSLSEYLIKTYTSEGDVVLDNCLGSGTTAVACVNTRRQYIGIEKEETYWSIACERVKSARQVRLQQSAIGAPT